MNTLQQAFVNGFIKRAAQHGVSQVDAVELLKQGGDFFANLGGKVDASLNNAAQPGFSQGLAAAPGAMGAIENTMQGNYGHAALDALMGAGAGLGNALSKNKWGRIASVLGGYLGPKVHHYLQHRNAQQPAPGLQHQNEQKPAAGPPVK